MVCFGCQCDLRIRGEPWGRGNTADGTACKPLVSSAHASGSLPPCSPVVPRFLLPLGVQRCELAALLQRSRVRGQIGGWEEQRILSKTYGLGLLGNGRETRFLLQSARITLAVIPQAAWDGRLRIPEREE